jgi:Tol biopolymer transport system component
MDGMAEAEPAWSPDGAKIAFVLGPPEHLTAYAGDGDIYLINADGTGLERLTTGLESASPAWSPDGTRVVFTKDQGTSLVIMNADGTGAEELRLKGEAYPPYQSPTWSPDGTDLAFQASPNLVLTPIACSWPTWMVWRQLGSPMVARTAHQPGLPMGPCWRTQAQTVSIFSTLPLARRSDSPNVVPARIAVATRILLGHRTAPGSCSRGRMGQELPPRSSW